MQTTYLKSLPYPWQYRPADTWLNCPFRMKPMVLWVSLWFMSAAYKQVLRNVQHSAWRNPEPELKSDLLFGAGAHTLVGALPPWLPHRLCAAAPQMPQVYKMIALRYERERELGAMEVMEELANKTPGLQGFNLFAVWSKFVKGHNLNGENFEYRMAIAQLEMLGAGMNDGWEGIREALAALLTQIEINFSEGGSYASNEDSAGFVEPVQDV